MSRLELKFDKDPQTFRNFFGDEELQAENKKLYLLLSRTIEKSTSYGRSVVVTFKNNISAVIEAIEEDVFFLTISDPTVYEYHDNSKTKLSKDRILHYLDYMGSLTLLET